ncbi:hypothetical protein I6A84_37575 [Frankia sp. CNm7]|uniref:Secreted protein n=1 Tax=Frankia nepalensis TaxID=1836974 RepID=A0A937ULS1_9ACTN|nr:hypothetical protein [Frankia nepalensis]MBL7496980.1 hypothetical protein [Frankia nepalensis]MBL7511319.1 hypothetical protein [Frankia nepalensis]MBL7523607.1 hypothetical protein [Frankia nepalensis]MBL7626087.1 hypothetical protein [Frankia nepalensis]
MPVRPARRRLAAGLVAAAITCGVGGATVVGTASTANAAGNCWAAAVAQQYWYNRIQNAPNPLAHPEWFNYYYMASSILATCPQAP